MITGPPAGSDVGRYDVVASEASNPNYDIRYVTGSLDILPAELTVTPEDQTRVYGDPLPTYTASFGGLVNGDTKADITGLQFAGPPKAATVGDDYDIHRLRGDQPQLPLHLPDRHRDHHPGATEDHRRRRDPPLRHPRRLPRDVRRAGQRRARPARPEVRRRRPESRCRELPDPISGTPDSHYANYDITYLDGTERVTPAPLIIRASDKTRRYGAPSPTYTTVLTGLTNFDTRAQITGLTVTGAPAKADVGTYPIEPKGAVNPNYDISYVNGTETVTRAPLGITAENKSKVYGAPDPVFTATYDGLVNGDTPAAIGGLGFATAPTGSDVGSYPIVASGATVPTTRSATPTAPRPSPGTLTIKAADKTTRYGTVAAYTWTGQGWVNGDSDTTIAYRTHLQGHHPRRRRLDHHQPRRLPRGDHLHRRRRRQLHRRLRPRPAHRQPGAPAHPDRAPRHRAPARHDRRAAHQPAHRRGRARLRNQTQLRLPRRGHRPQRRGLPDHHPRVQRPGHHQRHGERHLHHHDQHRRHRRSQRRHRRQPGHPPEIQVDHRAELPGRRQPQSGPHRPARLRHPGPLPIRQEDQKPTADTLLAYAQTVYTSIGGTGTV